MCNFSEQLVNTCKKEKELVKSGVRILLACLMSSLMFCTSRDLTSSNVPRNGLSVRRKVLECGHSPLLSFQSAVALQLYLQSVSRGTLH